MWGVKGEEKWRQDRTGAPEGRLGEGKGSHAGRGKLGNHWEGRGTIGSVARFWGPQEPAEIPGLILYPWRPPPAVWVLREWGEGRGAKVKSGPLGPAPLRGDLVRGRVPTLRGTHLWLGVQRDGGDPGGDGGEGQKEEKGTRPVLSQST